MSQPMLVVAKSRSRLNKFDQPSLMSAINLRDFLEETGEYDEVAILQLRSEEGLAREWITLQEVER